jgi:hypothetical protein
MRQNLSPLAIRWLIASIGMAIAAFLAALSSFLLRWLIVFGRLRLIP